MYYYFSSSEIFLFIVMIIVITVLLVMYLYSLKSKINQKDFEIITLKNDKDREISKLKNNLNEYIEHNQNELKILLSNKQEVFPYLAGLISDYMTLEYDWSAYYLSNKTRPALKEAKRIQELKTETKNLLAQYKVYEYQLNYLLKRFPALSDELEDEEFSSKEIDYTKYDPIRNWITDDEWTQLSESKKNQLALDRYNKNKKNWQIGRDYELYVGQQYENLGYQVEYHGMEKRYEDHGCDLIAKKENDIILIQCKYRGKKKDGEEKEVHENSLTQLLGTTIRYSIENHLPKGYVKPYLITNKTLDSDAKKCAAYLEMSYIEKMEMREFPQIKCNISKTGEKIYHLPMDQQYDKVKINQPGECYAYTVDEAEQKGFRRAFRYNGLYS